MNLWSGKAVAGTCGSGGDYMATSGMVSFTLGQQVKTINVPVCSDDVSEPDETFLVMLSGAVGRDHRRRHGDRHDQVDEHGGCSSDL